MKMRIEFSMDGPTFTGGDMSEVESTLHELADDLGQASMSDGPFPVRDSDGAKIGQAEIVA